MAEGISCGGREPFILNLSYKATNPIIGAPPLLLPNPNYLQMNHFQISLEYEFEDEVS